MGINEHFKRESKINLLMFPVIICIGFLVAIVAPNLIENKESKFATYSQLESSDLIKNGWVPNYLPRSAYDIHETHNIDTNEIKIRFSYKVGDIQSLVNACDLTVSDKLKSIFHCEHGSQIIMITLYSTGNAELIGKPN